MGTNNEGINHGSGGAQERVEQWGRTSVMGRGEKGGKSITEQQ